MEYKKVKLSECCKSISDGDHLPPPKSQSGVPFITISNIDGDNQINFNGTMFVPDSYYDSLSEEKKARIGDILYSVVGSFGKPVFIDFDKRFVFQRHIAILKPNDKVNSRYLYYVMLNPDFYYIADKMAIGAAQRTITLNSLRNMTVNLHDIAMQNAIVDVLSCIDKKIQCNNKINDNLQHQLKLMYDYWFTQFDFPDENGKPYRSSGGAMVWNEQLKREIPVNWKAEMLSDVFEVTMGSSPTGDSLNDNNNGIEFYQGSTDFGSLYPTERIYTTAPIRYAQQQDVLLSVRAPVGALNIAMNNCCIGRGLAAIHHESTAYAWCTLKALQTFFDIFNANGTTFGALTSDDLKKHYIISPENDLLREFIRITKPLEEKMRVVSKEIRQLTSLRDWLLPMLMNGQATISD